MVIQWHITNKCNLRCTHCYQEEYNDTDELTFDKIKLILGQLTEFQKMKFPNQKLKLTVTGGEPLMFPHFKEMIMEIKSNSSIASYSLLTNGHFVNDDMINFFKEYPPSFVQVSLDGAKKVHEKIRGGNSFNPAIEGIKKLVKSKIRTSVSFTANKENYKELVKVSKLCSKMDVDFFWTDRIIDDPKKGNTLSLKKIEVKSYINHIRLAILLNVINPFTKTHISSGRALQFLSFPFQRPYKCSAGNTLLALLPNGDLMPCRRMEYIAGNLFSESILNLYNNNTLLKELRDEKKIIDNCEDCKYKKYCNGGLKCLSYAKDCNPFQKDPGCFLN